MKEKTHGEMLIKDLKEQIDRGLGIDTTYFPDVYNSLCNLGQYLSDIEKRLEVKEAAEEDEVVSPAQKMFEELGYKKIEYNEWSFIWIKPSNTEYKISFYSKSKSFSYDYCGHSVVIDIPLLEAIIQQCRELGWVDYEK